MEVTSKRPVGRKRQVVEVPTRHARDPRFDPLSGQLRAEHFKTAYSFLDDYRQDEIKILAEEVRNTRDPEERMRLQDLLSKMRAQDRIKKRDDEHEALKRDWRKKELDLVKQGKKPYYLKKSRTRHSLGVNFQLCLTVSLLPLQRTKRSSILFRRSRNSRPRARRIVSTRSWKSDACAMLPRTISNCQSDACMVSKKSADSKPYYYV